jgi:ABC-type Fe3+/spermidine/putrescine transport system ATPase subunit
MLELKSLCKRFGARSVADHLDLTVEPGEILALLGPSGCGKSTLLAMVAGLETPDAGRIVFDGVDLASLPPESRHFALMFQDYALFPHLNVLDNVMFGLVERRVARVEARERALSVLGVLGLEPYATRDIETLSGGEAQRVALARALVTEPRLILLDEPFSSLDAHLRLALQSEFRVRLKQLGICAIWVTHDRNEAFAMADRVALLHEGRVQQCATPGRLLTAPANPWVARFIGFNNVTDHAVVPDAAFLLGDEHPAAVIEDVIAQAEGAKLRVRTEEGDFVLQLSAREVRTLGTRLQKGKTIGLAVEAGALIRFGVAPVQESYNR